MNEIGIDAEACVGCGECARGCLYGAISIEDGIANIAPDVCTLCGSCVDVCPVGALSREGGGVEWVAPGSSGVWVCGEVGLDRRLHASTLELLTTARGLAAAIGEESAAVVVANRIDPLVPALASHGAQTIYALEDERLDLVDEEMTASLVAAAARAHTPSVILMGATPFGRSVAPRIAAKLQTGLTADCTQLGIDPESKLLVQTRPAFGGNLMARIICPYHRPQMATVRPGVFKALPMTSPLSAEPKIVRIPVDLESFVPRVRILQSRMVSGAQAGVESAETIVAGGLGLGSKQGFQLAAQLAEALGGAVGASRSAVDEGWAPASCQVGQTGRIVSPNLYVALGISGAVQHTVGMQSSGTIIAVNCDPHAAIFQVADLGVVAPAEEAVPELIEMIRRECNAGEAMLS